MLFETEHLMYDIEQLRNARDFRLETIGAAWTSSPLTDQGGGVYIGFVPEPAQGWSAFLVELTFDDGIILTTEVAVTPDVLPFEGQACLVARSFAFF